MTERSTEERITLLEELLRARILLFSELEHKLKTSFAVIAGWADLLTRQWEDMSDDDRREAARWLQKKSVEVVDQAEALLEHTQAELAALTTDRERVDAAAVARELALEHGRLTPSHSLVYDGDDSLEVVLDPGALYQVLAQLVENAVKYTPAGGAVVIRAQARGGEIELCVEDQGVGVPTEPDVDIFAPFVRGPAAEEIAGGTGIGLYVVANLVRLMRGRVTCARNASGVGSTFTVLLPRV